MKLIYDFFYNFFIKFEKKRKIKRMDEKFLAGLDLSKCKLNYPKHLLINDSNREFVYSLNKRQAEYYFSCEVAARSLVELEERIYRLEQQGKL